jgi:hypothetical protein
VYLGTQNIRHGRGNLFGSSQQAFFQKTCAACEAETGVLNCAGSSPQI